MNGKELAYQSAVDELSSKSGLTFTKYYENQTTFNGTYGDQYDNSDLTFTVSGNDLYKYKVFIVTLRLKYDSLTIESTAGGGADLDIVAYFNSSKVIFAKRLSPIDITVSTLYVATSVTLGTRGGGTITKNYRYSPVESSTGNYTGWIALDTNDDTNINVMVSPGYTYYKAQISNGLLSLSCYGLF